MKKKVLGRGLGALIPEASAAAEPLPSEIDIDRIDLCLIREKCADTLRIEMLSSLLPNKRRFTRLTRNGLTTIRVGNQKFPLVQRLAMND